MRDASIDYDQHAPAYPHHRQADPRIAARIHAVLGDARTVLNVGAGSGYLDPALRAAQSVWPRLPDGAEQRALTALSADLASGAWEARHGYMRAQPAYNGGLRLIVSG